MSRQLKSALTTVVSALVLALLSWLGLGTHSPSNAPSTELSGLVTAVGDGDSITLQVAGQARRIRLAGIDAPELDQSHGPQARAALVGLCLGRLASVAVQDTDRYGRTVGTVRCGQADTANAEQVRHGHAWVYERYNQVAELETLEKNARRQGLGLWARARPTPPWDWRERKREQNNNS